MWKLRGMTIDAPFPVFIGHDAREQDAYDVCVDSLLRRSSIPLHVTGLYVDQLKEARLFRRTDYVLNGQRYDSLDGKPFSTDFAFTRFLVPLLCGYRGWAVFCDCDFIWLEDIAQLVALQDPKYAVMVVQHDYKPQDRIKMDGQKQEVYPRKNWSSMILWNCDHPSNQKLTADAVNTWTGASLHGFSWLNDDEIGALPPWWNWLEGWSDPDLFPSALHYTRGVPSMKPDVTNADLWRALRYMQKVSPHG